MPNPKPKNNNKTFIVILLLGILPFVFFAGRDFWQENGLSWFESIQSSISDDENKSEEIEKFDLDLSNQSGWKMQMELVDFGVLEIESRIEFSPKMVENFVKLVNQGFYQNSKFERMVKQEDFNIIQGGNEKGQGVSYIDEENRGYVEDELWQVAPQFENRGGRNFLSNEAKLNYPDLYGDFDQDTGTLLYPKGLLVAYSDNEADKIGSQFFITLTDTIAPAEFPAFARISRGSFEVLDKILETVDVVEGKDGFRNAPSREIKIKSVRIIDVLEEKTVSKEFLDNFDTREFKTYFKSCYDYDYMSFSNVEPKPFIRQATYSEKLDRWYVLVASGSPKCSGTGGTSWVILTTTQDKDFELYKYIGLVQSIKMKLSPEEDKMAFNYVGHGMVGLCSGYRSVRSFEIIDINSQRILYESKDSRRYSQSTFLEEFVRWEDNAKFEYRAFYITDVEDCDKYDSPDFDYASVSL